MRVIASMLVFLAVFSFSVPATAGEKEERKVVEATEVMNQIRAIPEKSIPPELLANARGVAIIPGVIKVGFVVGGRYGQGVIVVRGEEGWSDPVFVTITGASLGWQIGAQSTDVILVFKTGKSVEGVTKGKFTLGADAAIAAGPVGRQAQAATDIELKAEIYSYSRSRGLFAGVSLEGAALQIDEDANRAFYGPAATPEEIFSGKAAHPSDVVSRLKEALK